MPAQLVCWRSVSLDSM